MVSRQCDAKHQLKAYRESVCRFDKPRLVQTLSACEYLVVVYWKMQDGFDQNQGSAMGRVLA